NAWDNRRYPACQLAVDRFNLGEVGNLGRSADITQGRQQVVLGYRAQQNVGAKTLRTSLCLAEQLRRRHRALADQKSSIVMPDWSSGAVFKVETQSVRRRDFYLRVIACSLQLLVARQQRLRDFIGPLERPAQDRLHQVVQLRIKRVEKNYAQP